MRVFNAAFACDGSVEEISAVELDGGLVGRDF
jgi:hypothetical protein